MTDPVLAAAHHLSAAIPHSPAAAVILGSGLGGLAERVEEAVVVPYAEIPGFPDVTVTGHRGRVVAGRLGGRPILAFQGRFHLYEGHDPEAVVRPVRTAAALGASALIVTCAAGGVNRSYHSGTLMLISDHLNLTGRNPLVGPVRAGEVRFPGMTRAYDTELRTAARKVAALEGIELVDGVYAAVLGPSYETPAEIRMIEALGGDAVGMSTVPEVIAARAAGLRVLGIALITNPAAGLSPADLDHGDVVAVAEAAGERLERLVTGVLAGL
jgi:purine-nucleoside phosphorylase